MPRLLLPLLLATAIHALLLATQPAWLTKPTPPRVSTQTIHMRLMSRSSHQPSPNPAPVPANQTLPKAVPEKKTKPRVELPPPPKTQPKAKPVKQKPPKPAPMEKKIPPKPSVPPPPEPQAPPEASPEPMVDTFEAIGTPDQTPAPEQAIMMNKTDHRPSPATNTDQGRHKAAVDHEAVPLYRSNPAPPYPRLARKRGYEGEVLLEVLVDIHGRVEDLNVFKSSGYAILDRQAIKTVRKWRFEPATRGTKPVAMWVRVPMKFQLRSP